MSCIVLDIELTEKKGIKKVGIYTDGKFQGYPFRPPIKYKPAKQAFWCTRNLHRFVWISGRFDYSELPNILPRAVKVEYFAKGTKKCKILGILFSKEVEILDDHGCPKFRISLTKKFGFARVAHLDTRAPSNVQRLRRNCFTTG